MTNGRHSMNEFERIAKYFKPLASGQPGALGLTDDAAVLTIEPGRELVTTADAMVEGVHFLKGTPADLIAAKLLTVNLSDLAAMGARPHSYLLTLALPSGLEPDWLDGFVAGLERVQGRWGIDLVGGDSVSTAGPISASVTAMGTVAAGEALLRSGASAGEDVYVTGTIGGGVLGLMAARNELAGVPDDAQAALKQRYDAPTPRIEIGQALIGLATAAVDVSDGLPADLGHIARASGVGIRLNAGSIPLSPEAVLAVSIKPEIGPMALAGGDDYELAFTAPRSKVGAIETIAERCRIAVTKIGETVDGAEVSMMDDQGKAVAVPAGWQHF